jgi:hypothetical protein
MLYGVILLTYEKLIYEFTISFSDVNKTDAIMH